MELLFSVKLQDRADKVEDAVVPADGREGVYIGSADGRVEGKKLSGTMRTSMFSGDCPVPGIRKGAEPPKGPRVLMASARLARGTWTRFYDTFAPLSVAPRAGSAGASPHDS